MTNITTTLIWMKNY